ncbi:DUF6332 family protein [Streptomyces buecherae]|uniref:DUF6332 family protein n=1 Tax=Streptomyces buecherae TaxID=2763006 RepID=UPI0037BC466E
MDMGRESRWEKDAMTVEIGFALASAAVLAGAVFAVVFGLTFVLGLTGLAAKGMVKGGAFLGVVGGVWRVVWVLSRFDAQRRQGR